MGNKGCVRTIGKDHKDKQIAISPAVSHPSPKKHTIVWSPPQQMNRSGRIARIPRNLKRVLVVSAIFC